MILRVLDLEYVFHIGNSGCSNQQMEVERATPVSSRLDGLTSLLLPPLPLRRCPTAVPLWAKM